MTRPVITDDEMSLYFRLYSECTKNSKTDWPRVMRLWNLEVVATLREQEAGRPAAQLGLKNAKQLQQFEKSFVMEMTRREAVMLHDASLLLPTTPIASSFEQAVNNQATRLMEGQRRQQEEQQEAAAVLAGMNQQSGGSGLGLQKGSGVVEQVLSTSAGPGVTRAFRHS
jgi:predicted RecB family endonuclease